MDVFDWYMMGVILALMLCIVVGAGVEAWCRRERRAAARGRPVGAAGGSNEEPGPIAAVREKVSTRTHVLSENSKKIIDPENGEHEFEAHSRYFGWCRRCGYSESTIIHRKKDK